MPMSYSLIIIVNLHSIGYTQLPSYVLLLWLLDMCVDWFGHMSDAGRAAACP